MDWRNGAACRGLDEGEAERFFPLDERADSVAVLAVVHDYCRVCPVVAGCLSWALAAGQDDGVWGGLSSPERRAMRAPERAAVAAAAAAERRAREDAHRDAVLAAEGEQGGEAAPPAPRPPRDRAGRRDRSRSGASRSRRASRIARCRVCARRDDLRADGSMVRHDRIVDGVRQHCAGSGERPVPEPQASERVHGGT